MKKLTQTLLLTGLLAPISIYGGDASSFEYKVKGLVQNWSKFGLNDNKINVTEGKYPTESFSILSAELGIDMNFGAGFSAEILGAAGGFIFDNTKFQRNVEGNLFSPNGLAWSYFGYWQGFDNSSTATARTARNFILRNAQIAYKYDKYIQIQIGRFQVPGDWINGFVQGAYLQSWIIPHTKLWFWAANRRASYGGKWLREFRFLNTNIPAENDRGFFVYKGGADVLYQNYSISPYILSQDARFFAPGVRLSYDTDPAFKSEGFRSKTEIAFLYMHHFGPALKKSTSSNNYKVGELSTAGKGGQSLLIKQRFDIDNYNIGLAIYKNFDNPNEFVASIGDPTGFDNYNASVYDGSGWNNVFRKDSISGFIFGGGNYERFSWGFLGRLTFAPRADEQTLAINFDYQFPRNIKAGIKAEYYGQTIKEGYIIRSSPALKKDVFQDRSSITTYITHNF